MSSMSENRSAKVLVRRASQSVAGDETVQAQAGAGESAELELISTQMLKQILSSNDESGRSAIEEVAKTDVEGVLARHTETGYFEIIDDE